jgi:PAS domain S-box-containing protein
MSEPAKEQLNATVRRLEAEIARCRAFLDGLGAAVFVGNRDRILVDVNHRACTLLGYSREELVGKPAAFIHVESDLPLVEESYPRGLAGQSYTVHYTLRTKDAREIPVELRCEYVEVAGEPLLVALVHDISHREDLLRKMVEEERLAAAGTLAAGVAHQFNNLLARIMACAEDVAESSLPPSAQGRLDTIVQACEEASQITERLLSYARRRPPARRPVNPVQIIEHSLQIVEDRLKAASVEVLHRYEPVPDMMLDNTQMAQTFINLILNAVDAMPSGGRLTVSCRVEGEQLVIQFADTGVGIPPKILECVFEPFVTTKGALSRSTVPGMGLGLCVCQGNVASHGGTITADSKPGEGTTFTIRLPLRQPADGDESP